MNGLVIVETHPVQYHAPVWRAAAAAGVPLQVIYGSDFSVRGYHDREFSARFAWDRDLLGGYDHQFLCHQAAEYAQVQARGLDGALNALQPRALLALGYWHRLDRAAIAWARSASRSLWFRGEVSEVSRLGRPRARWLQRLRCWRLRRLYRCVEQALCIGTRARQHYLEMGMPAECMINSPYAVDATAFDDAEEGRQRWREQTRTTIGAEPQDVVVAFSGKFSRRKGLHLLPEALQGLSQKMGRRVHLLGIGQGELREQVQRECAQREGVSMHCTGFVNQGQLSPWYHAADLLALPSLEGETWGLVVNDALHHGLPVVVSEAVGCAPDLALPGRTGEIGEVGSPQALTLAMERCLQWAEQDAAATRANCRNLVSLFSIEAAAKGVVSAWQRSGGMLR